LDTLSGIVEDALADLKGVITDDQLAKVSKVIEATAIRGILEGQHRAVDACIGMGDGEGDIRSRVVAEIRRKNDLLIANLSSMR
jgi:cell division GTPase FtsZ